MNNKELIEQTMKKFGQLNQEAKEFVLGYLTGKNDEKQAEK